MVMAQIPETTEFDSMTRNVIDPGLVDYILPADEMAAHLIAYAPHPHRIAARSSHMSSPKFEAFINKIRQKRPA